MRLPFVPEEKEEIWAEIEGLFETLDEENISRGIAMAEEAGIEVPWGDFWRIATSYHAEKEIIELDDKLFLIKHIYKGSEIIEHSGIFPFELVNYPRKSKKMVIHLTEEDHINPSIFEFTELEFLEIEIPLLEKIPDEIGKLTKLKWLEIDCKNLTSLGPGLQSLDSLEDLLLYGVDIEKAPIELFLFPKLKRLEIGSWGNLLMFPLNIPINHEIKTIKISSSPKVKLPPDWKFCPNLEQLVLNDINSDFNLSDFSALKKLKNVEVTGSSVKELPPSFCHFSSLEKLDFSWTPIEELPDCFYTLTTIQELHLRNTHILEVSPLISNLKNLKFLDLSQSHLIEFPIDSLDGLGLSYVNLSRTVFVGDRNPLKSYNSNQTNKALEELIRRKLPEAVVNCKYFDLL